MKINVEFDLTPDEFRQSLGLPDVELSRKTCWKIFNGRWSLASRATTL